MSVGKIGAKVVNVIKGLQCDRQTPARILIVLANPRSGSTWMFDALRCHPAIYVNDSSVIYERLGIVGRRRYPRDIPRGEGATCAIEVLPGQWKRIPHFSCEAGRRVLSREVMNQEYAIEKIHPHFFDHDVETFLRNVGRLEKEGTVRFIYQVRDPRSSMVSFLDYRERCPSWNRDIGQEKLSQHMERIYRTILRTARKRAGLVVDYSELVHSFQATIARTFDYLWPSNKYGANGSDPEMIHSIGRTISREKRKTAGGAFFGKMAGPASGSLGKYEEFFSAHPRELERSYRSYRSLLELG